MAATLLFGHLEILHTLIEMGSAALAAAVPYSGKGTRIFRKDKEVLKYILMESDSLCLYVSIILYIQRNEFISCYRMVLDEKYLKQKQNNNKIK